MEVAIVMAGETERREAGTPCIDPEFLLQFLGLVRFRVILRARSCRRENSQSPFHRLSRRALAEQDPTVAVDQRYGRDENKFQDR